MIYPYLTLNDGTEYTHSEMKADGTILVYVETPDAEDGFHSLLCVLPKYEIKDVIGYTKDEQEKILARIKKNGRLQVQVEQNLSSNYISGIHLIKKSVEQFIRSVVA